MLRWGDDRSKPLRGKTRVRCVASRNLSLTLLCPTFEDTADVHVHSAPDPSGGHANDWGAAVYQHHTSHAF